MNQKVSSRTVLMELYFYNHFVLLHHDVRRESSVVEENDLYPAKFAVDMNWIFLLLVIKTYTVNVFG